MPSLINTKLDNIIFFIIYRKKTPHSHGCTLCKISKREYSFKNILVTPNCTCRISKKQGHKSSIVRPAKLNLSVVNKKNTKSIVLRPSRLHFSTEKSTASETSSSKVVVLQQNTSSLLPNSQGKVFTNAENNSQNSFKALLPNRDTDILKAFDTLSFKELRSQPPKLHPPSDSSGSTSKRENNSTNSCSVQARMESSLYADCDETSIEELASYFDLFVHIPKKMSSMAEMMYI